MQQVLTNAIDAETQDMGARPKPLKLAPFKPLETARKAAEDYLAAARLDNIALAVDDSSVSDECREAVNAGDDTALRRVLLNLVRISRPPPTLTLTCKLTLSALPRPRTPAAPLQLTNAIRAVRKTPPSSSRHITIVVAATAGEFGVDRWRFAVDDTGPASYGSDCPISTNLVKRMGGALAASRRRSGGRTRVAFALALSRAQPVEPTVDASEVQVALRTDSPAARPAGDEKTVAPQPMLLIVDDEPLNVRAHFSQS